MKKQFAAAAAALLVTASAATAQTRHFTLDTPRAMAGAESSGIAIHPDGALRALPPLQTVATFDEPLGLALAVGNDGTAWVGTGHPARVWRVRDGRKELVAELQADQITSLLLAPGGELYASTILPTTIQRIRGDRVEEAGRLPEGVIWDLAWFRGGVVAAAGLPGRILRLGARGPELAAEIPDQHARSLAVAGDTLLIGTSGRGLVLRWSGEGAPGVLHDSDFTEIVALVPGSDGVVFAAGLTGDPTLGRPGSGDGEGEVTVSTSEPAPTPSPPQTSRGTATSEILRILPAGAAFPVHRFSKQIAAALAWNEGGLVIGTGLEGELWQLVESSAARLDTVDAAQVTRIARGGDFVLTQGPVALLQRRGGAGGTFTSPVLDARQPSRWGLTEVTAGPAAKACNVRFRSGATEQPDGTWSPWSETRPCGVFATQAPPARYLQWQLRLDGGEPAARVSQVRIAYRQLNLPPRLTELTVHEPGEIFLRTPPPSDRVVEVNHPQLTGIFTTLGDGSDESNPDRPGKKYYRIGYRSLSWKAEDPNGDPLRFRVEVQRQGSERWWTVRQGLESTVLGIDTQALAEGVYRFRLTASDASANPEDPAEDSALSSWITVDNSPPAIAIERQGDHWLVTVQDALSPLTRVEWNRDAEAWRAAAPEDGMLDGRRETFRIPAQNGNHVLAVRAVDAHHNRATVAVEEQP
jgi:hypothetical protein